MVEVKQKTLSYKLKINTRDYSITLEAELKAVINVKGNDLVYEDKQQKFVGYIETISSYETKNAKENADEILNERFEKYANGLKVLEQTAEAINAEIEIE
ncbi:SIFV.gp15/gp18/gp20-like protein [Sulfolobus islandicus filamentous virus 2]|uniref:SIFV.gp15/gp18/gp20-like protein n=1 Tax=Sulfolobus islandicus filamentous virus 2 TaxID=1902331 RepID=A0A1D8BJ74_SIFV|nr:SIFV.gp15/gp18/gp20-like protein [Sulfolobus islandicus filamentous virus 2]